MIGADVETFRNKKSCFNISLPLFQMLLDFAGRTFTPLKQPSSFSSNHTSSKNKSGTLGLLITAT